MWGVVSIMFVTVTIGVSLTNLIHFPDTPEFVTGMVIYFTMPTTISSAIVLTQQARANSTIALLLSIITNVSSVFTIPPMLDWIGQFKTSTASNIHFNIATVIVLLVLTVLTPLIVR